MCGKEVVVQDRTENPEPTNPKDASQEAASPKAASPKAAAESSKNSDNTDADSVQKLHTSEGVLSPIWLKVELLRELPWKSQEERNDADPTEDRTALLSIRLETEGNLLPFFKSVFSQNELRCKELQSSSERVEAVDGKTRSTANPKQVPHLSSSLNDLIASTNIWDVLEDSFDGILEGTSAKRSDICLILGLDGLLLFQGPEKKFAEYAFSRPPDFQVCGKNWHWIRKSSDMLFFYTSRRASIGFWNVADSREYTRVTINRLRQRYSSFQEPLFTFNRSEDETRTDLGKPCATFKILDMVWSYHSKFSERNTLLIDHDVDRTRFHKLNRVVVPKFTGEGVQAGYEDDVIAWLVVYLEFCSLGYSKTGSVQNAINCMDFLRFVSLGRSNEKAVALVERVSKFDVKNAYGPRASAG
uniref:FCP1 homology domain-containing protein n=1 Tax=Rhodosorus marinus TaxID=101924 RepID=A0A7S0G352_9RHOD|mmetsp:Transcript_17527/g.25171  ORF Transcript_17527/g.25171 Transcript_17527/m.25171 type:complete len:415 (+) Transcript_17527:1261-2505(+)